MILITTPNGLIGHQVLDNVLDDVLGAAENLTKTSKGRSR